MNDLAGVLEALGTLLWPILAGLTLWKLYPSIRQIIESKGFKIRIGEMEVTVQEASDQLRTQVEDLQQKISDLRTQLQEKAEPATREPAVEEAAEEPIRRILWVDDHPENNAFEIASMRSRGLEIRQATSTDEALNLLFSGRFEADAVISDMGRTENGTTHRTAGLALIEAAREADVQIPIFIYASSNAAARYQDKVLASGGNGITASPVELYEMIRSWNRAA